MAKRSVSRPSAALARTAAPVVVDAVPVRSTDGLENVIAGLGGDRDKASYSTYGLPRLMTQQQLENIYRGSWLAGKIIDAPAEDMTREWRNFIFDSEGDEEQQKAQQRALENAEKRLQVKAKVTEAIRWARLYGGAVIVIGTRERDLSKPLVAEAVKRGDLRSLHVLDRYRVSGGSQLTMDMDSPNFGLPEFYTLAESNVRVHWTRVLRFEGQRVPYFAWQAQARWHDSVLQRVMDAVMDTDTTSRAVATMVFEANVDVISTKLAEVLGMKDGEKLLVKRFQLAAMMKSFNRALVLDAEDEYHKHANSFANLDKVMDRFATNVSAACDVPKTRLFGESSGGLNATGDNEVRNYYDMVAAKQEADLRPQLEYLDGVLVRSELGNLPDDYRFEFRSLWQLTDLEQSEVELNRANRDEVYLSNGVLDGGMVATELRERGTYTTLTDDDVQRVVNGELEPEEEPEGEGESTQKKPVGGE